MKGTFVTLAILSAFLFTSCELSPENEAEIVMHPTSMTITIGPMDYTYNVTLNEQNYPESIFEKLGSSNSRIIRYRYMSR